MKTTMILGFLACVLSSSGCNDNGPTADDTATVTTGGSALTAGDQTVLVANTLFNFDPTIQPTALAEVNARAIGDNTTANLIGCGAVTVTGAMVTANFGASPGCTVRSGLQLTGSVTVAVTRTSTGTALALTFANLTIDGRGIDGTAMFATTDGSTFQVTASLTADGTSTTANLTVAGGSGTFTVDGSASSMQSGSTNTLQFTHVTHAQGDCYPNGGTLAITHGAVSMTLTFTSATASSGAVTVTEGRRTFASTLPAYGHCPSASDR